jgi:antitoxin (DNA-binding transcriptional repressor) of toxin-antitoxin stability system
MQKQAGVPTMTLLQITVEKSTLTLERLLALVQGGAEVVITQDQTPVARITPVEAPPAPIKERIFGAHPGAWMNDDFDDPLPDSFWLGDEA